MRINSKLINNVVLAFGLCVSAQASASLSIFTCEPEYASLAKELAPDANIYSATTALQDPHQVQARPSLIAKMRRADLVVCAGADLEVGWLPMLQMKSANNKVNSTDKGLFYAAEQIETLDQLDNVSRSMGDVHAKGNPHLHLDPYRLLTVSQALTVKLIDLDPSNKTQYETAGADFTQRWQNAISQWEQKATGLSGKKVIAYHTSFRYLFNWLGMEQAADLEPKPGLAPTSSHLASLLTIAKQGDISAIVVASYQDPRGANWLAEKTGLPVIILPLSVGGNEESSDLFNLYANLIQLLTSENL